MEAAVKIGMNNIMRFFYLFWTVFSTTQKRVPVDISEYIDVLKKDGMERDAQRLAEDWVKVGDEIENAMKEYVSEGQEEDGQGKSN